jgi:hypothetical protein
LSRVAAIAEYLSGTADAWISLIARDWLVPLRSALVTEAEQREARIQIGQEARRKEWQRQAGLQRIANHRHRFPELYPDVDCFEHVIALRKQDEIPHSRLVFRAQNARASRPAANASSFAEWVYQLYATEPNMAGPHCANPLGSLCEQFNRALGRYGEEVIEQDSLWLNEAYPRTMSTHWRARFVAVGAPEGKYFVASRLRVGGMALRCVPDVVLENRKTGDILIIERKVTRVPVEKIPALGWPNLKVQLWCYGWIDDWRDAPNVWLVGQLWGATPHRLRGLPMWKYSFSRLPLHPMWQRREPVFQSSCAQLFQLYGGTIQGIHSEVANCTFG